MKNIIRVLFGIPVVLSIPIPPTPPTELPIDIILESLAEKDNCCDDSCGYRYCPSLDNCIRPFETYCQEFDFPYNLLYKSSGIILPGKK
tara:strand:- start:538 stop:804 length:267 start_codon:yes stop_codon:yes gene_type:complete